MRGYRDLAQGLLSVVLVAVIFISWFVFWANPEIVDSRFARATNACHQELR
jgi:hypothetical protein